VAVPATVSGVFSSLSTGIGSREGDENCRPRARRPAVNSGHARACRPGCQTSSRTEDPKWGSLGRLRSRDVPHGVPPEVFPCFQSSISRNVASAAPVILLPLEALPSSALAFSSLRRLLKMQLHQPSRCASTIVVSPTTIPTPFDQVASSVTVITAQDLERDQLRTVPDALNAVPGLNVVQTGGQAVRLRSSCGERIRTTSKY